jgi:hypothetical protein
MAQANAEAALLKPFAANTKVSNAPQTQITKLLSGTRVASEVKVNLFILIVYACFFFACFFFYLFVVFSWRNCNSWRVD